MREVSIYLKYINTKACYRSRFGLGVTVIYCSQLYLYTAYLFLQIYIYTQNIFLQSFRCTVDKSSTHIVASRPGMRVTLRKAWRQGRSIRQTPSRGSPCPGRHSVARRISVPAREPVQFFQNTRIWGKFRERRWVIMLVSPCNERLPW